MSNRKNSVRDKLLLVISILIGMSYISVFMGLGIHVVCNVLIIAISYFVLLKFNSIYPVVFLILSARIINGFTFGISVYGIMSILTSWLPSCIYILLNYKKINAQNFAKRKMVYIFLILTWVYFFLNYKEAMPLMSKQVAPITLFCVFISGIINNSFFDDTKSLLIFFRITFVTSLLIYLLPDYQERLDGLLVAGNVFGQSADVLLEFKGFSRNCGLFFDHRLLGIFVVLYLYVMIRRYGFLNPIDLCISLFCILTTTSRGSIIPYAVLLIVYYYSKFKQKIKKQRGIIIVTTFSLLIAGLIIFDVIKSNEKVFDLVSTLDLTSENNALSQRSVLSLYALNEFYHHPIFGTGLGVLTGYGHTNFALGDGLVTNAITDAYLFSLLAEMGIIGFICFVLSFYSIVVSKKDVYSLSLFLCFMIQLTGTDLPNMFMFYFVMLLLLQHPDKTLTLEKLAIVASQHKLIHNYPRKFDKIHTTPLRR